MPDDPEAPSGEPADASAEMARTDDTPTAGRPAPGEGQEDEAVLAAWWRRDPEPPRPAPSSELPPTGTPPYGTPPAGAALPPGAPPPGGPPWGGPPWAGAPWGGPPWGGPPWYYGWGPGWQGAPPQPPASSRAPSTLGRHSLPWVIVGGILGAIAMVAVGLGIGFSVWGTTGTAAARSSTQAPSPRIAPAPGNAGFLGVGILPASRAPGATSTSPTGPAAGAYVVTVVPSSPAAKAGIVRGDTITSFATHAVRSAVTLQLAVVRYSPGTRVTVAWTTSGGKHDSATVTLAHRPKSRSLG